MGSKLGQEIVEVGTDPVPQGQGPGVLDHAWEFLERPKDVPVLVGVLVDAEPLADGTLFRGIRHRSLFPFFSARFSSLSCSMISSRSSSTLST